MRKLFLLVLLMTFCVTSLVQASAFDTSYFKQFKKKEIIVKVETSKHKTKTVTMYLLKIDYNRNTLVGKVNALGKIHVPIEKISLVYELPERTQRVFNHH